MEFSRELKSVHNPLNLPNLLSIFRLVLVPVMGILLAFEKDPPPFEKDWMFRYSPGRIAAVIVIIAGISDLLDGWLARHWKIESLLGKFLDPVADKVFMMVSLIMLMQLGRVPEWLVILLLSREFLVTALRGVAAGEGIIISAGQSGKFKLIFQMIGVGFLMWYGSFLGVPGVLIGTVILYLALIVSLFSGFYYLRDFFIALAEKKRRAI